MIIYFVIIRTNCNCIRSIRYNSLYKQFCNCKLITFEIIFRKLFFNSTWYYVGLDSVNSLASWVHMVIPSLRGSVVNMLVYFASTELIQPVRYSVVCSNIS